LEFGVWDLGFGVEGWGLKVEGVRCEGVRFGVEVEG